jgi:hypothetical protein
MGLVVMSMHYCQDTQEAHTFSKEGCVGVGDVHNTDRTPNEVRPTNEPAAAHAPWEVSHELESGWFVVVVSKIVGPLSERVLKWMIQAEVVTSKTYARHEQLPTWQPLESFPHFRDLFDMPDSQADSCFGLPGPSSDR